MPKTLNFDTPWDSDYWMESNGFFCGFNMPKALVSSKGANGEEVQHGLPEYNWRKSYLIDEYPACPPTWMKSEGKLTSYFVPIKEGDGMWLDFNKNTNHSHHIAVVISIQGVNALTGLACESPNLEQYIECCPKHNKKFGANRFCEECGFKWPKQNYLCTTATPSGYFWLDGFRAANGTVCQYILTEKTMRGVASNIIGSKRVYAIGISYFLSKDVKPFCNSFRGTQIVSSGVSNWSSNSFNNPCLVMGDWDHDFYNRLGVIDNNDDLLGENTTATPNLPPSINVNYSSSLGSSQVKSSTQFNEGLVKASSLGRSVTSVRTKNIEIGAGASIVQHVYDDPEPLDFWREQPEALLTINYVLEEEAGRIIAKGKISKTGDPKGFLKNVQTGNEVKTAKEGVC